MKKIYFLLIALFITKVIYPQQWILQNSGVTKNLCSVFCINNNNVFIAGQTGTVLKTTNGGANWNLLNTNTSKNLNSIFFVDSLVGFSVGADGTIIKTTNCGNTWNLQISNSSNQLNCVYFTCKDTGYVVGTSTFLKTTNGGTNWIASNDFGGCCFYLNSIIFTSKNNGRILGYDMPGTIIFSTTNAGNTWRAWVDPEAPYNYWWEGFAMTESSSSDKVVVAGEDGNIFHVYDASGYWYMFGSSVGNTTLISVSPCGDYYYKAVGDHGIIGVYPNNGPPSCNESSGVTSTLNSIVFSDETTGFIAGDSGVILKSNYGNSINKISNIDNFNIYPNPAQNKITIHLQVFPKLVISYLYIYNIQDQLLIQQPLTQNNAQIDISQLTQGIYLAKLQLSDGSISQKKFIVIK
jgi:hypothetical protein